ncbi:conserved hypothetical protein [Neospora caninum Liverpool]|uniref:Uncharacterized protein n=1 Tax=Neospora caninum (strain Liverpool) TaxID=572307 RepID=F0VQ02_NEOCL|nr:conserved hypothetical protein [Neospora caninum Liverpool]CBZ55799.1 conserved hypothetical protein [Neospora caninum Liverpool]CEL70541.1 TPA: hypothetical protein BN1204_062250 [Neospora caninum Liverpool]|eukprot:XP_003885825.1 conserved hypothetical protein [Neospora caninum Liverpool]
MKASKRGAKMAPARGQAKGVKRASGKPDVQSPIAKKASSQRGVDLGRKGKTFKKAAAVAVTRGKSSLSRSKRDGSGVSRSDATRGRRASHSDGAGAQTLGKERAKGDTRQTSLKRAQERSLGPGKQEAKSRRKGGTESRRKQKSGRADEADSSGEGESFEEPHFDQWYDDYYRDELNVSDETLLDVLVDVIKRHHGRHYYGVCMPTAGTAGSEAAQPETDPLASPSAETEGNSTDAELSSLTSDALQVKKAWAFVAEDAAHARALTRSPVSSAPASRKAWRATDRQAPRRHRGEERAKERSEEKTEGLRTRWQCFLERRSKRLEVERVVQNEIDAVEEKATAPGKGEPDPQSPRGAKEETAARSPQPGEEEEGASPQGGEGVSCAGQTSQNEDRLQKRTVDDVEEIAGAGGGEQISPEPASDAENAPAAPARSDPRPEEKNPGRKDTSQAASPSDGSQKETPQEDEESADDALAEKLLRNLTKSPSDDESSPSSSSSETSSYAPSSPESDNEANSEAESCSETPSGEARMGPEASAPQPETEAEGKAAEAEKDRKVKRRKKAKWEKPRKSKETRLREKEKERARERQLLESELSSKSACVGMFSAAGSPGTARMKDVQMPRAIALRPQCLYHFESLLETQLCSKYPNGMTRRGALCSTALRVEETLEFFLLCRFLNLFSNLVNVPWTFDDLASAISSPPGADPVPARSLTAPEAGRATESAGVSPGAVPSQSPSFPSFLQGLSVAGGSGSAGDAEKGEPGGVLRQILTKLFGFLGRRMTPGMSLTRMCGRYVEEKRRDGSIPPGILWPFDYPVKAWQSCDGGLGEKKRKRKEGAAAREEDDAEREKASSPEEKGTTRTEDDGRKKEEKNRGSPGGAEADEEGVLLESVYNPFKVCEDWGRLKSIHKLRVVRLLIEHAMSESPQISKALKGLTESELEAGFKGYDDAGRLYWVVPQCGDPTVFKLYREDPHAQQVTILCEDISALESVAEALGMDEMTAGMSAVLLEAHQQILVQEKQRSRELRRQKAISRQLEISNWGFVPTSSRREKKAVDYTFSAYEAIIEGKSSTRGSTRLGGPSFAESQRQDRSERLRARQARKEEQSVVAAVEAMQKDGEGEDVPEVAQVEQYTSVATDGGSTTSSGAVQKTEETKAVPRARPPRKRQPKSSVGMASSPADGVGLQESTMTQQHRQHQLMQQQHVMAALHQQKLLAQQQAAAYAHRTGGATLLSERQSQAGLPPAYRQTEWMSEQTHQPIQRQPHVSATTAPPQQALDMLRQRVDLLRQSLLQRKDLTPEQRQALYQQGWAQLSADFTRMTNALAQTRDRAPGPHATQQAAGAPTDERALPERNQTHESRDRRLPVQNFSAASSQLGCAPTPRPQQRHAATAHAQLEAQQESRARAEAELQRQRLAMLHEQQQVLRAQQQQMQLLRQQHEQVQARQRVVPPSVRQSAMTQMAANLSGESGGMNASPDSTCLVHEERTAKGHVSRGESLSAAGEGAAGFFRKVDSERRFCGTEFSSRDGWGNTPAPPVLRTLDGDRRGRDPAIEMRTNAASVGSGEAAYSRESSAKAAAPKPAGNGHVL